MRNHEHPRRCGNRDNAGAALARHRRGREPAWQTRGAVPHRQRRAV